jgi:hypothetical protein
MCDGDLGVAAFLLDAGVATGDDEWIVAGRRIASDVAARVLAAGGPTTPTARLDRRAGLMNGYAGVVSGLLHATDPWSTPSATSVGLNLAQAPSRLPTWTVGARPYGARSDDRGAAPLHPAPGPAG